MVIYLVIKALEGGNEARVDLSDEFSDGAQATGKRIFESCRAIAKMAKMGDLPPRTRVYAEHLVAQLAPASERIKVTKLPEARPRAPVRQPSTLRASRNSISLGAGGLNELSPVVTLGYFQDAVSTK